MKTIRHGLFETNSSASHSITIFTVDEWANFKDGNLLIDESGKLVPSTPENLSDEDTRDYSAFVNDEMLETAVTEHTTSGGDKIVAVCKYGVN